jgi:hypothetical protein
MLKTLGILIVGICIGYWLGFSDAQVYSENIAVRMVHRIGGTSRGKMRHDTDRLMDSVETK